MNLSLRRLLAAALVGALVLLAVYAAERTTAQRRDAEQRAQVGESLRGLQLRLGDALRQRLALLRDLRGLQHLAPGERAPALAARLGADRIDYAWIAPLSRIDTVWPRAAADRWRGRDLLRDPLRGDWLRAAALRGDALLTVAPRADGGGEVGRLEAYLPLYRPLATADARPGGDSGAGPDAGPGADPGADPGDGTGRSRRGDYWGVAVLGFAAAGVLQDAGLFSGSRDLELALRVVGASDGGAAPPRATSALVGVARAPLFGHRGVFYSDAMTTEFSVGGLRLQLAALPRQGWRGAAGGRFGWLWRGLPLALCGGLLLWAAPRRGMPRPWLAAGAAALAVALLSGVLLWLVADRERESRRQQLRRDVELGQGMLDAQLAADRQRLRLLAARRPAQAVLDGQWREGAQRLLAQRAELLALDLWQSGDAAPRRLAGKSAGNSGRQRRDALAAAAARRALLAGRAHYRLDAGGELQLWLPLPATDWHGAGAQVLGLRYAMPALLAEVLPPNLRRRYHVQVVDAGGEQLAALARTGEVDPALLQQTALAPLDYAVALRLGRYRAATLSAAEGFYLGVALLLALALFGALWQLQRRQRALRLRLARRTRRQLAGNRALREDIRQRERAEAALRESESRYRAVFECSNEAILIVDPQRDRIVDANPTACALLDYPRDDLLATPISAVHPGELAALRRLRDDASRSGGARSAEFTCLTRAGERVPVELSAAPIECAGDTCLLIVARDQRERLASEAELRAAMGEIAALKERVEAENLYLREEIRSERHFGEIICRSEPMLALLHQLEQVAPSEATVLLLGESGTGKELLARALHGASGRAERALVKVNCAALPENLIESELFGHERGAFSGAVARRQGRFELADGGTLFLDEIGELPLALQAKLLRVLQEGEIERLGGSGTLAVDVRIIAATNRDLARMVAAGEFREDLYYRLNVFPLHCPPLRERREDIPLLVEHFTARHAARAGRRIEQIPQPVMARLEAYHWPGNVRELENVIERAVVLGGEAVLRIDESFASAPPLAPPPAPLSAPVADEGAAPATLAEVEARMIRAALRESGGVIEGEQGAARRLGLAPSTFRERMKKYRIERRATASQGV